MQFGLLKARNCT